MNEGPPVSAALPESFPTTRDALRTLACYVIAPARKAIDGRIGLRPTDDRFGTPVLPDGSRIVVRVDEFGRGDDATDGPPATATTPIPTCTSARTTSPRSSVSGGTPRSAHCSATSHCSTRPTRPTRPTQAAEFVERGLRLLND